MTTLRCSFHAVAACAALVLLAGCSAGDRPSEEAESPATRGADGDSATPSSTTSPPVVSSSEREVTVGGTVRTFREYLPPDVDEGPAPLVLMFHGSGDSATSSERRSGWNDVADREGFVVAYPEGVDRSFNAGTCCGTAMDTGVDDVAAALAIVDDIAKRISIDPDRMYVSGFSNGGAMAYRLACETDRFAAIGPVGGGQLVACSERAPTSILHIHGAADARVPIEGAPDGMRHPPVEETLSGWRSFQACAAPVESDPGGTRRSDASCDDGREINLVVVDGLDHEWPTADDGLDGAETLWEFFARHGR